MVNCTSFSIPALSLFYFPFLPSCCLSLWVSRPLVSTIASAATIQHRPSTCVGLLLKCSHRWAGFSGTWISNFQTTSLFRNPPQSSTYWPISLMSADWIDSGRKSLSYLPATVSLIRTPYNGPTMLYNVAAGFYQKKCHVLIQKFWRENWHDLPPKRLTSIYWRSAYNRNPEKLLLHFWLSQFHWLP